MLTYVQAAVIGAVQGVTELFPVSSLGHSVLFAAWLGGDWQALVGPEESESGTPYLAFVVALHVATAIALLWHYRRDWYEIVAGLVTIVRTRRPVTVAQRLAWLIVLASVPVAILGPWLVHPLHALFAAPICAAFFLTLNGVVLLVGEGLRRRNEPTLAEYGRRFALQGSGRRRAAGRENARRQADRRLAAFASMYAMRSESASLSSARC